MTTITRTVRALVLAAAVGGLLGACAEDGGGGDDAVASLDDSAAAATDDDGGDGEEDGDGGGGGRPDDSEFRDAALEYAECMRDHGIDMPDPTFDEDGGTRIAIGGPDGGGGPDVGPDGQPSEELQAAEEECRPILEEAAPDIQLTPEEQAELQDRLVAMAECMRSRGHDVPDPQVGDDGRVTIGRGPGQGGGPTPGSAEEDAYMEDTEECNEEAGLDGPPGRLEERGDGTDDEEEG